MAAQRFKVKDSCPDEFSDSLPASFLPQKLPVRISNPHELNFRRCGESGDPTQNISDLRKLKMVMKGG